MGTWGHGSFDNDTACEWGNALEKTTDPSLIETTLQKVANAGDDLDGHQSDEAVAAADVVARLKGKWGVQNPYTETIDAWVLRHRFQPSPELTNLAVAALDRILTEPSELLELWGEGDDDAELWRQAMNDLRSRLMSS